MKNGTTRRTLVALGVILAVAAAMPAATIDLNGGDTHNETPGAPVTTPNALNAFAYSVTTGGNGDNRIDDIGVPGDPDSILLATPISHIIIDGPDRIDYRDDNDFRNGDAGLRAQGFAASLDGLPGLNQNDNFATVFRGEIVIPDLLGGNAAYNVEFGTNRADDPANIYVDLDQDGIFENTAGDGATAGNERVIDRSCCGNAYNTISITPGTYNYLATQLERGGGSNIEPTIDLTPDAHGRLTVEPGDAMHGPERTGLFQYTVTSPSGAGSDVHVDGLGNVIDIAPSLTGVAYGALTFDADTPPTGNNELSINSTGGSNKEVSFTGTSLGGAANTNTLNINNSNTVSPGAITGAGGLNVAGNGTLNLDTAGTYTGVTNIGGSVAVQMTNGNGLGATGAGNGTVVASGASLRLSGTMTTNEDITINGTGPGNNGALYAQVGGTKTIAGLVQTGSESRIHVDDPGSPRLLLTGGFALNHKVTVATDGTGEMLEIATTAITGTGELRKEGNGRIEAKVASPGYSGTVRVNDGYVEAWVTNALGTGQIIAENDGTLLLRNGLTLPNNITISTDGEGTAGAIRSENNTNTLTGKITSTNNGSRIHVNNTQLNLTNELALTNNVNIYGGGTLNITGDVTGNGTLNKNDGGRTILAGAGNTFTGALNVNAGTVEAADGTALNSASAVTVNSGGTLELSAPGTYNVPITIAGDGVGGAGALVSTLTDKQIDSAINVSGTTIGNSTAGTTLTINGALNTGLTTNVTFTGAGDTVVTSAFGNGGPGNQNALWMTGYMNGGRQDADLNFDPTGSSGGGLLADTAVGATVFAANLDINGDGAFRALIPGITRNDDYQTAFQGQFHALVDGNYTFQTTNKDDRTVIWLDMDNSGTFDNSGFATPGTSEQLVGLNNGSRTVALTAGTYDIAMGHMEHGGGSRIRALVQTPGTAGPTSLTVINPGNTTAPAAGGQAGLFTALITPTDGVTKTGAGTLTLQGANSYNGVTSVQDGTLVAANSSALGVADGTAATGTTVDDGATLALQGNITINNEAITLNGLGAAGQPGAMVNISGNNTVQGPAGIRAAAGASQFGIGSQTGALAVDTDVDMQNAKLIVNGGGDVTVSGVISGLGSSSTTTSLLDYSGGFAGATDLTIHSHSSAGIVGDKLQLTSNGGNQTGTAWHNTKHAVAAGFTSEFTLEFLTPGNNGADGIGFIVQNHASGTGLDITSESEHGPRSNTDLTVTFDSYNGGGTNSRLEVWYNGAMQANWLPGYDLSGNAYDVRVEYTPGDLDVWFNGAYVIENVDVSLADIGAVDGSGEAYMGFAARTGGANEFHNVSSWKAQTGVTSDNSLVKDGTGTLTLSGDNTYDGTTTVNTGTLLIDGTTSGQGSYIIQSGATLGGTGTIGLAPGASITVHGDLSPGDSIGTLTVTGDLVMDGGTLVIQMDGTTDQTDLLTVEGMLNLLNNPEVEFDIQGTLTAPAYVFATYGTLLGNPFANEWNVPLGYSVNYAYAGNQIALVSAIPEPMTMLAVGMGIASLGGYIRKRRRA